MRTQKCSVRPPTSRVGLFTRACERIVHPLRWNAAVGLVVGTLDEKEELDGRFVPRRHDDFIVSRERRRGISLAADALMLEHSGCLLDVPRVEAASPVTQEVEATDACRARTRTRRQIRCRAPRHRAIAADWQPIGCSIVAVHAERSDGRGPQNHARIIAEEGNSGKGAVQLAKDEGG